MNRNQGDQFIFIQAPSYRKPRATSIKSKKTDPLAMPYGGLYLAESLMRRNISMCILLGEIEELKAQITSVLELMIDWDWNVAQYMRNSIDNLEKDLSSLTEDLVINLNKRYDKSGNIFMRRSHLFGRH